MLFTISAGTHRSMVAARQCWSTPALADPADPPSGKRQHAGSASDRVDLLFVIVLLNLVPRAHRAEGCFLVSSVDPANYAGRQLRARPHDLAAGDARTEAHAVDPELDPPIPQPAGLALDPRKGAVLVVQVVARRA